MNMKYIHNPLYWIYISTIGSHLKIFVFDDFISMIMAAGSEEKAVEGESGVVSVEGEEEAVDILLSGCHELLTSPHHLSIKWVPALLSSHSSH